MKQMFKHFMSHAQISINAQCGCYVTEENLCVFKQSAPRYVHALNTVTQAHINCQIIQLRREACSLHFIPLSDLGKKKKIKNTDVTDRNNTEVHFP